MTMSVDPSPSWKPCASGCPIDGHEKVVSKWMFESHGDGETRKSFIEKVGHALMSRCSEEPSSGQR